MTRLALLIMMVFLIPILLYSDGILKGKLLYQDPLNETLNRLLQDEFQQRVPKERVFGSEEFLHMATCHRLTPFVRCTIRLSQTNVDDPEEALKIFFPYAKAYVDTMNNVREARPYFVSFPYTIYMWNFTLNFARDPKTNRYLYDPYICGVRVCGQHLEITRLFKEKLMPNGRLCRDVYANINEHPKVLPKQLQEIAFPHFDAPKTPTVIPQAKSYCYFNNGLEQDFTFFRKFANENGLILTALDYVFVDMPCPNPKSRCFEEAFAAQEKYFTLEESRQLVSKITKGVAQFSSATDKFENWVNAFRKRGEESLTPNINLQEYMGFRISFWDQYIDRVQPPHIAEIWVRGSKAQYYVSDELQRLQLIHEENLPRYDVEVPVPKELLKDKPKDG